MCECMTMARTGPHDTGLHHHKKCQKYETEKFPYLLYYEEAIDAWTPATGELENIITIEAIGINEIRHIAFKRVELTDAEYDALPED